MTSRDEERIARAQRIDANPAATEAELNEAICAMQSLDDLGSPEANEAAMQSVERLQVHLKVLKENANDWTIDPVTHRTNSSPEFLRLSEEVGRLIRNQAHALLAGRAADVGGLVMAQLAHVHGLVPRHLLEKKR